MGAVDQRALCHGALGAGLGEAGRDHHQATRAGCRSVGDGVGHPFRRHRDQRQIDRGAGVGGPPVGRQARHPLGAAVHRHDRPGETAVAQVTQHGRADPLAAGAGAVDRHRPRGQQPGDRPGLGELLPGLLHLAGPLGGRDREGQVHHAVGVLALHLIAEVAEHP
jgi:hypothetical protein